MDAKKASNEGNDILMWAYYGRAMAGGVAVGSVVVGAYNFKNLAILKWCTRVNLVTGVITLAASYAIDKLKEKEWIDWLKAEPFRKSDSTKTPHRTEALMLSGLADAVADMN